MVLVVLQYFLEGGPQVKRVVPASACGVFIGKAGMSILVHIWLIYG